jgi:hypothetical protein
MPGADDGAPPRYRFGPLERRGLVAGWRGGQIGAVAGALVMAVGLLRAHPSPAGALAALAVVAVGLVAATWPIGGRTAEQWVPDAVRHLDAVGRRRRLSRRRIFGTLRFLDVDLAGTAATRAGVVFDVAAATYTAVLSVSGPGFVLLGATDKARRVGGWSAVLASLAHEGTAVHRIQWIERSLPDDGAEVRRDIVDRAVLGADSAAGRSYAELVDRQVAAVHRHEVMLAVTIHAGHSARAVRAAGRGQGGACALVLREAAALARRLGEAGIDVAGLLTPDALTAAVRRGFETDTTASSSAARSVGSGSWRPRPPVHPGPMGLEARWGSLRTDATWHVTYWIAEWPRTDVAADFLGPLLLLSDLRRSVAVVMEPVGPLQAARRIEQARTADIADAELRRRGGFLATARRRREEEVLLQREDEQADGHASFRFSGYITVTASDGDELEENCGRIEQVAGQCGLELRRCYGDQALAFTCTLPLGRGLA